MTYIDVPGRRAAIVYEKEKRVMVKFSDLHVKVEKGTVLKIFWKPVSKERIDIVRAENTDSSDCPYIEQINGHIVRPANKPFAYIRGKGPGTKRFIPPKMVQKYNINGGEKSTAIAVYDYDKKKKKWAWTCVSLTKQ